VIGFHVVQWDASGNVKCIVISLSVFVVTLLLYDIGVRRTRLTRFLFGMRLTRACLKSKAKEVSMIIDGSELFAEQPQIGFRLRSTITRKECIPCPPY